MTFDTEHFSCPAGDGKGSLPTLFPKDFQHRTSRVQYEHCEDDVWFYCETSTPWQTSQQIALQQSLATEAANAEAAASAILIGNSTNYSSNTLSASGINSIASTVSS
ncbi:unnamed protein product, partial [Amoebophrya sp. A25]|eukprot:GSA25T00006006001.1